MADNTSTASEIQLSDAELQTLSNQIGMLKQIVPSLPDDMSKASKSDVRAARDVLQLTRNTSLSIRNGIAKMYPAKPRAKKGSKSK